MSAALFRYSTSPIVLIDYRTMRDAGAMSSSDMHARGSEDSVLAAPCSSPTLDLESMDSAGSVPSMMCAMGCGTRGQVGPDQNDMVKQSGGPRGTRVFCRPCNSAARMLQTAARRGRALQKSLADLNIEDNHAYREKVRAARLIPDVGNMSWRERHSVCREVCSSITRASVSVTNTARPGWLTERRFRKELHLDGTDPVKAQAQWDKAIADVDIQKIQGPHGPLMVYERAPMIVGSDPCS